MSWDELAQFFENHPVIISAVTGVLSGTVATFFAPWVHWGIEKKKARMEERRQFLKDCRAVVNSAPPTEKFREGSTYARLRPLLSQETVKFIEIADNSFGRNYAHIQPGGRGEGVNNYVPAVLDEIARIERKWKLL